MSGDFSRSTFAPKKHYSGVRMQQGRVQVDADWNEQVDIAAEGVRARTRDLVGASGGPSGSAGFALRAESSLVFEGRGDHVHAPALEAYVLREGEAFTVEVTAAPRAGGAGGPIVAAGHLLLSVAGGRLSFHYAAGASVVTLPLSWDAPRRLVAVYDGKKASLHVDGKLVPTQPGAASPDDPVLEIIEEVEEVVEAIAAFSAPRRRTSLRIGGAHPGAAVSFDGVIRDVRLLRTALAASDVAAPGARRHVERELVIAHYPLSEGSDMRAHDRSPLGNDARLVGPEGRGPRWRFDTLRVGPGRYYVDGILCENEAPVSFEAQPDLPGERLPQGHGTYLAVLDVWERIVDAHEDPDLREVALGGVDTAVRTRTVWQVRLLTERAGDAARGLEGITSLASGGAMRARYSALPGIDLAGNRLYRVEIHDDGHAAGSPLGQAGEAIEVTVDPKNPAVLLVGDAPIEPTAWRDDRWVELSGHGAPLLTTARFDATTRRFTLAKGVSGAARHLKLRRIASYKWSNNNALDVLPIQAASGKLVTLGAAVGDHGVTLRDATAGDGKRGDWVEIIGDRERLRGEPGPLTTVDVISDDRRTLTLRDALPTGAGKGDHPVVRRWDWDRRGTMPDALPTGAGRVDHRDWDRHGAAPNAAVVPVFAPSRPDDWAPLERGLEVQFTGHGPYRSGEHWLLPVRVENRNVEWPGGELDPASCAPEGRHRFARLASVRIGADGIEIVDLRSTFVPLADLRVPGAELTGPITIRGPLHVEGPAIVAQGMLAETLTGALGEGTVHARQLAEHAVTAPKLAPHAVEPRHLAEGLGVVPEGFAILGPTEHPPPGFAYVGEQIEVHNPEPRWRSRPALPAGHGGRTVLVTVVDAKHRRSVVYALFDEDRDILRFDEALGWVKAGERRTGHKGFAAVAAGHHVHILGGADDDGLELVNHDVFDTQKEGSTAVARAPMIHARTRAGAVAVDDQVIAVGGTAGWLPWRLRDALVGFGLPRSLFLPRGSTGTVEIYDPEKGWWRSLPSLGTARSDPAVGVLHDRIHVVGGRVRRLLGSPDLVREHEALTLSGVEWEARTPLPAPRAEAGAAVVEGRLYVSGGLGPHGSVAAVEAYNPLGDAWHTSTRLAAPRHGHGSTGLFGDVFVAGGRVSGKANVGAASCPVAATWFVHRKVSGGGGHALPALETGETLDPAPPERRVAIRPATALPALVLAQRVLVFLALTGLIAALAYGYWPGPRREPSGSAPVQSGP